MSYNRFVELMKHAVVPQMVMLRSLSGSKTGKYYIDSTKLEVCHNMRIRRHKVFKDIAKRGKTSTGWFFGFKLHIIMNDCGEIINIA
ncbi:transposase [Candidatus Lariskella endosymbiont of Hedychridium roseum]|uniref:transposase n=1 Tax=Candidatus Lariskella endosymbiont of Hedychridium roseum TaxID=3077949 RepID=UPI0030D4199F